MIWRFVLGAVMGGIGVWGYFFIRNGRKIKANDLKSVDDAADSREQLAELSEATGGLAHEIRNPLSTLKVNLDLLAEDWRDAEGAWDDVKRRSLNRIETLQHEAVRLQRILDDFLKYVGHYELHRELADVNAILNRLIDFTTPQATVTKVVVRKLLSEEPLVCPLDVRLVEQAMLNLFLNGIQAMPEGGELIIKSERTADGHARIDIADTGVGIAPENLKKVFKAYFSTKKQGTGLGLSVTQRIIREHGGRIQVDTQPDQGTTISLFLPLGSPTVSTSG
jgi:signal transduction histidine kinase